MGKALRKKHKSQMNNITIRIEDIWVQKSKEYFSSVAKRYYIHKVSEKFFSTSSSKICFTGIKKIKRHSTKGYKTYYSLLFLKKYRYDK